MGINIDRVFAMNKAQYDTWRYIMNCHDGFMTLDEFLDTMGITTLSVQSIQDKTWDYVCDIHDPDDIWYITL